MLTVVLVASTAAIYATDVPLPVELTALAMVGLILRVYLGREAKAAAQRDRRLDELEAEADEQRHMKHLVLNQLAGITGTLALVQAAAQRCSCGALAPLLPLIERLLDKQES